MAASQTDKIFGTVDNRENLHKHFAEVPATEQTSRWDGAWVKGITPWDRLAPSPALADALVQKREILGSSPFKDSSTKERKRVFIPGCGRGYDVLLFASHGFDAYGLDVSPTAIEYAKKFSGEQQLQEHYAVKDEKNGRGESNFVLGDFFKDDFFSDTKGGQFDVIYDYTFLCALPPALRARWSKRTSELLAPSGRLICLEFPLDKAAKTGGPPHGLSSKLYEELLKSPGREVKYDEDGTVVEDVGVNLADEGLVRIAHWRPERSHAMSQGKDMMSIWRHHQGQ